MPNPAINIAFSSAADTYLARSSRGVVAMILKEGAGAGPVQYVYHSLQEVSALDWPTADNYEALKLAFEARPRSVLVIKLPTTAADYSAALTILATLRWNYLTVPGILDGESAALSAWIKERRDTHRRPFKAVLPNVAGDHEGIINWTTDQVLSNMRPTAAYSRALFCARIAGILAALPINRSATYYVLEDVLSCPLSQTENADVDAGKLFLIFDGLKYKLSRGVNSLVTLAAGKTPDWKKIKIVEGHDLYAEDVTRIFEDSYVGQMPNSYDNKMLLVSALLDYQRRLVPDVLSGDYPNTAMLDLAATRAWLVAQKVDITNLSDAQILRQDTGSNVFLQSRIKFIDAMEDMILAAHLA